jgi:hypothetical protein
MGIENSPDAHRPSDTSDKINYPSLVLRARYAMAVVAWLANTPNRPSFAGLPPCAPSKLASNLAVRCSTARDPGLSAVPLTAEELVAAHMPSATAALKVVAVVFGLPAERAGLEAGDVVTAIEGHALATDVSPRLIHENLLRAPNATVRLQIRRGLSSRNIVIASMPP